MATTTTATLGKKNATAMSISNNDWQEAIVEHIVEETPNVKTYSFMLPKPAHHVAGQHYELQLTAGNGYQAARPYSASSTADHMPLLNLTIQHVPDGEVTTYLNEALEVGDAVEIRGPFGKFFTWTEENTQPILLIGGGSGVVPMHSILASHKVANATSEMQLIYSARTFKDIIFKEDFLKASNVTITLTQDDSGEWTGKTGRVSTALFAKTLEAFSSTPLCYVCGMNPFVSAVTDMLQELGIPVENIKTERFG